jgi:ribonuclease E
MRDIMAKEMLINVSEGEECRIALVKDRRLEELYMERTSATSHVGNIYRGRVTNVEPSIQAAFVDFGLGRNGFLHISDLMPTYFGKRAEDVQESVGRKMARRDRPPIQRCLRRGDEIIVQIIKEGIGTKGPTLSTYVSIPGRILVMMPGMSKLGVSRKIEDEDERRRLRQILDSLVPPKDAGFIIRTAGVGKSKAEIQRDLSYLTRLWQNIQKKLKSGPGPVELYTEGDLVTRTVRDVFAADIDRIVVDNDEVLQRVKEFFKIAMPRSKTRIELHEETVPLFHKYGIEKEIELMYSRYVPLPSGGSLVIDATEAVVAIDVNSGKFRDHKDAEMTAFKTDMEAADEIPRQLRLRDLGGVIICDFIDLRYERHRRELEKKLHDHLRDDRAKTKMLRMSQFGIIEMTRQRMRPSLKRSIYSDCPYCNGAGLVKTPESMALDVMRRLAIAVNDQRVARVEMAVCPQVSFYLQNRKRLALADLESEFKKRIIIRSDQALGLDAMKIELFDGRDGLVFLDELGIVPQLPQPGGRPGPHGERRDEQRGRREQRDSRGRRDEPRHEPAAAREREDMEALEDEVEERDAEPATIAGENEEIAPPPGPVEADDVIEPGERPAATETADDFEEHAIAEVEDALEGSEPSLSAGAAPMNRPPGQRDERRGRRRRGRRGRGRGRGLGQDQGQFQSQQPADAAVVLPGDLPLSNEAPVSLFELDEAADSVAATPPALHSPHEPVAPVEGVIEAPARTSVEAHGVPAAHVVAPKPAPEEEQKKPKRRRGTRSSTTGTKTRKAAANRRSKKAAAEAPAEQPAHAPAAVIEEPRSAIQSGVVRTGSTDRHLMRDEPVIAPPISRPRTYRDLDHIPDDLD